VECFGRLLPRQAARPAGQEQHIGSGQGALAIAPGNFLNNDSLAAAAIDAAHGVEQKDEKSPERDELETALGKPIVAGGGLMAAGADSDRTPARPDRDLNGLVVGGEAGVVVNESPKSVASV
jgi:hypothetical protein